MLIEVKAKVARIIEDKIRKKTETYILDKSFFSEAEYAVTAQLTEEQGSHLVENFELQSIKLSSIKEVFTQYEGSCVFIATLKDIFVGDDGTEKPLKYKIMLWADSLAQAHQRVQEIASQGYNMGIEGIKEVNYEYLPEETENESNQD